MARESFCVEKTVFLHLQDALNALKASDHKISDARELWCEDWIRMNANPDATAEMKAHTAKYSLFRMKNIAKVLATIFNSLQNCIELVSSQSSAVVQSVGFASLPDELLARIFELCYISDCIERDECIKKSCRCGMTLSSVCRRFRHITLHLPRLWQDVCDLQSMDWVLNVRGRCLNPIVFIGSYYAERLDQLSTFLQLLHPSSQWKGLDFKSSRHNAHRFFNQVSLASGGGDFGSMETLSLVLLWDYENLPPGETATTNISNSDATLLSAWGLSSLKHLSIKNLIPFAMNCPNLQSCHIELSRYHGKIVWDLHALKGFLRCVHLVESLSLTFISARSPLAYRNTDSNNPVEFPRLTSLDIYVAIQTESTFLRQAIDMVDAPALSKLVVSLDHDDVDEDELASWFGAIFMRQLERVLTSPPQLERREFSNVISFDLRYLGVEKMRSFPVPYYTILPTIPRLKHLRLDLFADHQINLRAIFNYCKDIRTIRVETHPSVDDLQTIEKVFEDPDYKQSFEQLEKIEVVRFHQLFQDKKMVEELLGNKFVLS